ncbi:MAG: HAD-IA family hydrolase [Candidatus Saccharimonadales bacterium]
MPKIKAVVFDVDGTLIDSQEMVLKAYKHVAESHGVRPPTHDEIMVYMGKSVRDISSGLFPDHDPEIISKMSTGYVAENAHKVMAFSGLKELFDTLKNRGIKLAVVTGGDHNVHAVLKSHDIEQEFTSIVHTGRITNSKPDPEGIRLALDECQVEPLNSVMIGDMSYDILAGRNAKVAATVGVTHGFGTKEDLEAAGADYILDSLSTIIEVIDRIEADDA